MLAPLFLLLGPDRLVSYPYRGPQFETFVARSYAFAGRPHRGEFYRWMDQSLTKAQGRDWARLLAGHRAALATKDPGRRTQAELALATDLHRALKRAITKFSLERGFEFTNTVALSERQCFLQSVVIAGLMQRVGVSAGVVMVWKNPQGQTSNNGHACVVVNLADGRQVTVDASDPTPFIPHQGLFAYVASVRDYRFLLPDYRPDGTIVGYRFATGGVKVSPKLVGMLDVPFLVSMFDFYRGERTPSGILGRPPTPPGLAASERLFRRSVRESPANPLSLAVLAQTRARQGATEDARSLYRRALPLYERYGWVPDAVRKGAQG
ncbi:MAG: hypothetical protein ACO1SV_18835 [Fimbriimonas sp.]